MKNLKKWMAGILATLVILTALPVGIAVTAAPATGSGTEDDPFLITTGAELTELATAVNGGADQTGVYYRLGNDITLSATTSIGDYTGGTAKRFNGVFDGNNFTISGVSITGGNYAGLFGHIGADGVVKNLNVIGSVSVANNGGGICGRNNGLLENCTFSGTVTGTTSGKQIGGIAAANGGTIRNCKTIAGASNYVQGSAGVRTGGIVGFLDANGVVDQCVNAIKIVGLGENGTAGGIVGLINAASGIVRFCANVGSIQTGTKGTWDSKKTGGIVGSGYGTVSSCYNAGTMTGYNVSGLIGNAYSGMTVEGCYSAAAMDGTRNGGIVNTNGGATFTNCYYLNGDYAWFQDGSNKGDLTGATQKQSGDMKTADFVALLNATNDVWGIDGSKNDGYPVFAFDAQIVALSVGSGTESDPYMVQNAADLQAISEMVNDGDDLSGVYFSMDQDIALAGEWTPIGSYSAKAFQGTFNGNGYTISGLSISSPSINPAGLFGYIGENGTVRDLNVTGTLSGNKKLGGIAGANAGTISGCTFAGNITTTLSSGSVGGIASENNGLIEDCQAISGTFTGGTSGRAGGIAGLNDTASGVISRCVNNATIVIGGTDYPALGGIVGTNNNGATVQYCVNRGTVNGGTKGTWSGHNCGGIVGSNPNASLIRSCYNVGAVNGYQASGLVGNNPSGNTVSDCYVACTFDATRVGGVTNKSKAGTFINCYYLNTAAYGYYISDADRGDITGATAISAAEMKKADFAVALNAIDNVWTIRSDRNGGYPVLTFEVDYVLNVLGATIRYEDPTGIRFGATVQKNDAFEALWGEEEYAYDEDGDVIFGMLVSTGTIPEETLLTAENIGTYGVNGVAKKVYAQDEDQMTYTFVIMGIGEANYHTGITVRAYMMYKTVGGEWAYVYSAQMTRSYHEVAQSILTSGGSLTAEQTAFLNSIS